MDHRRQLVSQRLCPPDVRLRGGRSERLSAHDRPAADTSLAPATICRLRWRNGQRLRHARPGRLVKTTKLEKRNRQSPPLPDRRPARGGGFFCAQRLRRPSPAPAMRGAIATLLRKNLPVVCLSQARHCARNRTVGPPERESGHERAQKRGNRRISFSGNDLANASSNSGEGHERGTRKNEPLSARRSERDRASGHWSSRGQGARSEIDPKSDRSLQIDVRSAGHYQGSAKAGAGRQGASLRRRRRLPTAPKAAIST